MSCGNPPVAIVLPDDDGGTVGRRALFNMPIGYDMEDMDGKAELSEMERPEAIRCGFSLDSVGVAGSLESSDVDEDSGALASAYELVGGGMFCVVGLCRRR